MRRLLIGSIALGIVLVAAGCVRDSGGVPVNAIAVVGDQAVTKSELERLLEQSEASAKAGRRPFPKPGTPQYRQIREQLIQFLVRRAQLAAEADARDIEISDEQVDQRRKLVVEQYFRGNEAAYAKQLKRNGVTEKQARADLKATLIQEALFKDVGKNVKVSDAEMRKHYRKNKAKYASSAKREIRHILLKSNQAALARRLLDDLRSGASFAQLARRHSLDPRSKFDGGRLELSKGQGGAALDRVAFSIPARTLAGPVRTPFGWHVLEALGPVQGGKARPYDEVKEVIRAELLQRKRNAASTKYLVRLARKNNVEYRAGFGPRA